MSFAIEQALISAIIQAELELDIVTENGTYSVWCDDNGGVYAHAVGVYKPDPNRPFLRFKMFPPSTIAHSLAHSDDNAGVVQVVVSYPIGVGAFNAKSKAGEVLALFGVGSKHSLSGVSANIIRKSSDAGEINGGFFEIIVRADYRAFTAR